MLVAIQIAGKLFGGAIEVGLVRVVDHGDHSDAYNGVLRYQCEVGEMCKQGYSVAYGAQTQDWKQDIISWLGSLR